MPKHKQGHLQEFVQRGVVIMKTYAGYVFNNTNLIKGREGPTPGGTHPILINP